MGKCVLINISIALCLMGVFAGLTPFAASDFIVGNITANDYLLYSRNATANGVPNQSVFLDVVYTGTRNISRIRALDRSANGTGGYIVILSGGVRSTNVTLRIESSYFGRGFNYFVDIYGR